MIESVQIQTITVDALKERAKELTCIYQVDKILGGSNRDLGVILQQITNVLPAAFQHPQQTCARLTYLTTEYMSERFVSTPQVLASDIVIDDKVFGKMEVFYEDLMPIQSKNTGRFLTEESTLLDTIARRLAAFIKLVKSPQETYGQDSSSNADGWQIALELLRRADENLYHKIARKMLNFLCYRGVEEAKIALKEILPDSRPGNTMLPGGDNVPRPWRRHTDRAALSARVFDIASRTLSDETLLACIQKWMFENRIGFLSQVLANMHTSLGEISDAMGRFVSLDSAGIDLPKPAKRGLLVGLLRRLITSNLTYIMIAKNYVHLRDFFDLFQHLIFPQDSHGLIGGKGAGMFLAFQILKKHSDEHPQLADIQVPKTWYITSDYLLTFIDYNNLDDVIEQKYKDLEQVRQEYSHLIELFKNSHFPPQFVRAVSAALDDLGDKPIIVRSSSLLEDNLGSSFSGKYKSLFLANQGPKEKRLTALLDAIAEVYSSIFGPNPIGYRIERNLIDFREEMAVIIQEVVGKRVGRYFLPAYSGVAFSYNEFFWSSRIKREDGLIRLVPGLGTRAVDRLSDDYPILIAPGQPGLRVNLSVDEMVRYSPQKIDLINLETNAFETMEIRAFLAQCVDQFPLGSHIISIVQEDRLVTPWDISHTVDPATVVVTFAGLMDRTNFVARMKKILNVLQEAMGMPVDIEFACDGETLYLLQCRPQSSGPENLPTLIPKNIPDEAILFSAKRYVSNGTVPEITHIVYVDPQRYNNIETHAGLLDVGRAVSILNQVLPKRRFVLMGPGRWGSRGDVKLGVSVTYADINNTAVLIEIARKQGNYVPDLSFGTHFFQDLVEASIRYLPVFPDDPHIFFNEEFLLQSPNLFSALAPQYAHLSDVIRVIDVPAVLNGKVLKIAMNADMEFSLAYFA